MGKDVMFVVLVVGLMVALFVLGAWAQSGEASGSKEAESDEGSEKEP